MGRVFLAVRDDDEFRQRVAIKIADQASSPVALRRFRRERQILAELDHPHIARLYGGGSTEHGRPYLVMEHIEGRPIHLYCEGLPVTERLKLLRKVLSAVAFAHRHLVVHLDLKPANILVDSEGEPRLLDFGISKLLGPAGGTTQTDWRPLTPEYASPEQLRGERLTTASDIYSLGLLLYRLLTGALPAPRPRPGGAELIPPSRVAAESLGRRRTGDLDAITLKTLRPLEEERYTTVEQLDADLERCLEGRPIFARPPTWRYRASRFARRHWLPLFLGGALLGTGLATAAVAGLQARRLAVERDRSELARTEAEDVTAFLTDLLGRFEPGELEAVALTVPDVLDRGTAALGRLDEQPTVRAHLLDTLGSAYRAWGRLEAAAPLLEESLAIRRRTFGVGHPEVAEALTSLGRLAFDRGDYGRASELHHEALDILRSFHGDDHPAVHEAEELVRLCQSSLTDLEKGPEGG